MATAQESAPRRYEAGSVEWLDEVRKYLMARAEGKTLDDCIWSNELKNPPAHLLRGDGAQSIGWTIRIKDNKVAVIDGVQHDGADIAIITDYEVARQSYRSTEAEATAWMIQNGPAAHAAGKIIIIGNNPRTRAAVDFIGPMRDDFYRHVTA